jgi:hypothetical protein
MSSTAAGQWQRVLRFDSCQINRIYFNNDSCGNRVGFLSVESRGHTPDQTLRTTDGGTVWIPVSGLPNATSDFAFRDSKIGWCSPYGGDAIFMTTDGGQTWNSQHDNKPTRYSTLYYNALHQTLYGVDVNNSGLYVSSDNGVSWTRIIFLGMEGFAFVDPSRGIVSGTVGYPSAYTTDGGLTWQYSNLLGDDFQPLSIPGTLTLFALCEWGNGWEDILNRSDDGGATWRSIYRFSSLDSVSGDVEGDLCHLFVQTSSGVKMSTDEGITWVSIGGPPISHDRSMQISGGYLYAMDWWQFTSDGSSSLWRYPLPETLTLSASPISVAACISKDTALSFFINGACRNSVLNSIGIVGSNSFQLIKRPTLPDTLLSDDSVSLRYTPQSRTPDTAYLMMSVCTPAGVIDTTIELFGSGNTPGLFVQFAPSLSLGTAHAGSVVTFSLLPDIKVKDAGLNSIDFNLSFTDDVFDITTQTCAIPGATFAASQGTVTNGLRTIPIHITGNNLSLDPAQPILQMNLVAMLADSSSTPITLSNLQLNGGDPNYRCTLGADISSTTFSVTQLCGDSTIQQFLRQGNLNFEVQSIVPNPTSGKLSVTLAGNGPIWVLYDLYDLLGHSVMDGTFSGSANALDVSALSSGSYYLRLTSGGEVVSQRVVVRR